MQRRHHYEQAFEEYLRARRIPYVAVDEARKALLPDARLAAQTDAGTVALKSFDFVIYGESTNLLVEVKGRRVGTGRVPAPGVRQRPATRLECWVTLEDVESLARWERLFGAQFEGAFVFVYWCEQMPPDALFQEIFERHGKWYALRAVRARDYAAAMRLRSTRWGTVHLSQQVFERISHPLAPGGPHPLGDGRSLASRGADTLTPELPAIDRLLGP